MKRICVFCGSSPGNRASYVGAAQQLGAVLANRGIGLVYGGGNVGLMGVIADAVLGQGGEVIGVIPQSLVDRELAHGGLTELRIVRSMHERKALMADLSNAFLALPGGFGTLDELCEMLTWSQLGLHSKPCGILNVDGFYNAFLSQIDAAVEAQFIPREHRALLQSAETAELLIARIMKAPEPVVEKWINRDEL